MICFQNEETFFFSLCIEHTLTLELASQDKVLKPYFKTELQKPEFITYNEFLFTIFSLHG